MLLTEDEAGGMWCPFTRIVPEGGRSPVNRMIDDNDDVLDYDMHGARCINSVCMAWRWATPAPAPDGPMSSLPLPTRAKNAVRTNEDCWEREPPIPDSIRAWDEASDERLLRIRNLGQDTLKELRRAISSYKDRAQDNRRGFCGLAGRPA